MLYARGLVIFHRNLRLADNQLLVRAAITCHDIIPTFIFSPRQVGPRNLFRSENAIQFMLESLHDLDSALRTYGSRLYCAWGDAETVVADLLQRHAIDAVFIHRDYTPFARERNAALAGLCAREKVAFYMIPDVLLTEPEQVQRNDGGPYSQFTSFFKKARQITISAPQQFTAYKQLYTGRVSGLTTFTVTRKQLSITENKDILVHGGAMRGHEQLQLISEHRRYSHDRDYPHLQTTLLSAYLKFGCLSVRQVYHTIVKTFSKRHLLIQQLYWRDFFTHVAYHFPHVFGSAFDQRYNTIRWTNDITLFQAWCQGRTGFPIVDAGMRQLNSTGWMHNRVRMIVASFLTKDLLIDWQWGEKYFAQQLVDYDPSVNNGNWQWVASTGCDAQPYFRVFNPWLQQKKYDADCIYIKRWVPELQHLSSKEIHALYSSPAPVSCNYPAPIVDHHARAVKAKQRYRRVL